MKKRQTKQNRINAQGLLLAALLLFPVACASTNSHSNRAANDLRSANVDEQIENVNYLIYVNYEQYEAAKKADGNQEEVSKLEIELGKLNALKSYLEAEQIKVLRELKNGA